MHSEDALAPVAFLMFNKLVLEDKHVSKGLAF